MRNKRIGLETLTLLAAVFFLSSLGAAGTYNATDTIQMWVTVANKTMVDIQPDWLAWMGVYPGTQTDGSEAVGFPQEAVQIENIGSTNISKIWFNNSYPADSPFATGIPSEYDAGNFVVIKRNTTAGGKDNTTYYFANRVEYNESELIYLQFPNDGGDWAHGRFRSGNKEWFWAVNATGGNCSDANFRIGKEPHNQSQLGSVDLRGCDAGLTALLGNPCRQQDLQPTTAAGYTGINTWGWRDLLIGNNSASVYENYTVAVHWNCSDTVTAMFYKWNMDAPGAQEPASHSKYFYTEVLKPGEHIIANVKLRVPYGTAAGNITGALTVTVQATNVDG